MPRKLASRKKQAGFIVTIELLLLASITVIGLIVGMTNVRDAVLAELSDISESIGNLDQSYEVSAVQNAAGTAATAGSLFTDKRDSVDATHPIDTGDGDAGLGGELFFNGPIGSENIPALLK